MKLWIDEDLSPSLVEVAHARGLDAACNRDRGLLGGSDLEVLRRCIDEDRTLVTNNLGDFRRLCKTRSAHPGLIVPPTPSRAAQQELLMSVLAYVERRAREAGAADSGEFMINRVVEVSDAGACADFPLPELD
jgi:predicted nuclease of predicted toxin-antitoxin system